MYLKNHDLFVIPVIIDLTSLKFHEVTDVHCVPKERPFWISQVKWLHEYGKTLPLPLTGEMDKCFKMFMSNFHSI